MKNKTTISIETQTREQIRRLGTKGESYDEILKRLISLTKKGKVMEVAV